MSGFEGYLLIAATTALAGLYELTLPVVWVLCNTNPKLNVVQYRWITYFVATMMMFIAAPLFLPLVLVPKLGVAFRFSLHKTLLTSQD